jgi:MFS family permease
LLVINTLASVIFNYVGIFLNLYVWQDNQSISDLCWYNVALFSAWMVAYVAGSQAVRKWSIQTPMILAAISGAIGFVLLMTLRLPNHYLWLACLAVPVGCFGGFYYCAQNLSVSLAGTGKEFSRYFSLANTIAQITALVNPIVCAVLIQWFGYYSSFALMFGLLCCMIVLSHRIPKWRVPDQEPDAGGRDMRRLHWREVIRNPLLRWLSLSMFAGGLLIQFQGIFSLVFTFSVTANKVLIALLNVAYTAATLIALYLYRRWEHHERRWLAVAAIFAAVGFLVALYPVSPLLVLSNFLTTVGMFYFNIVWNTQQFRVISEMDAVRQIDIYAWRECMIAGGRILVFLFVVPFHALSGALFAVIVASAIATALGSAFVQNKSMTVHAAGQSHGLSAV